MPIKNTFKSTRGNLRLKNLFAIVKTGDPHKHVKQ